MQHLPETHSIPVCVCVAVRLESIFLCAPLPSLRFLLPFFLPLFASFLPLFALSQRLELYIQSWQFTSTLCVIVVPISPNNQITETPHYASLSTGQMIPVSTLPLPKSDFLFPAASHILAISLLSLIPLYFPTFAHFKMNHCCFVM